MVKKLRRGCRLLQTHVKNEGWNGFGHWGFITEEVAAKEDGDIEAISIDEIMKRHGLDAIDICKINIEGTEKELFEETTNGGFPKLK